MKLTEEQKKLVEENHNLIYGFLKMHELDQNEYYDVVVFGLYKAATKYDLTRGSFSSFAYKYMMNEVRHQWAYDGRKCRIPKDLVYSYNCSYDKESHEWCNMETINIMWDENSRDTADIFIEKEKISKFLSLLKEDEQLIIKYLVSGFKQREIADKINTSQQVAFQRIKEIRRKWDEYNEKGYITEKKRGRKKLK